MMKTALLLSSLLTGAIAAPAIVWKGGKDGSVVHSSERVTASSLFSNEDSTAIFLLGRAQDGSETLSALAASGALPGVASKYDDAHSIHTHVSGIESSFKIASDLKTSTHSSRVLEITLEEFNRKMASKVDEDNQRSRALAQADILVINCDADAAKIDSAVVRAIESESIKNVVLAGIRSVEETKHERRLLATQKAPTTVNAPRRRLEDADAQNDDANANNNQDMEGVYYVLVTPNIFAGVLFLFFFSFVAWTGINCMGMIAGQDVFVHKYPPIGREA